MENRQSVLQQRVFIVYHGEDNDGYFSGALLKMYFQERYTRYRDIKYNKKKNVSSEQNILLFPGFYRHEKRTVDNIKEILAQSTPGVHYDNVLAIADFSFSEPVFVDLLQFCRDHNCHEIFWFDHHDKAIRELERNPRIQELNGTRNGSVAATRLIWEYVRDSDPAFYDRVETLINYIANYDVWNFDSFNMQDPHLWIQNATKGILTGSFNEKVYKVEDLLKSLNTKNNQKIINELLDLGGKIQHYVDHLHISARHTIQKFRWRKDRQSPWYTIAVGNITTRDGLYFNHVIKDVDFALLWVNREPDTLCSLRSFHKPDNSEVDVAELAGLFGGGGHRNASGFTMTRGQFNKQWLNRLHLITEDKKEG